MKIVLDDVLTFFLGAVTLRTDKGENVDDAIANVRAALHLCVDEAWATVELIKEIGGFEDDPTATHN